MPRTQGTSDISPRKKSVILAKKNLQVSTQQGIAAQEKVCRDTVAKIKPESVPPDVLELAKKYEKQFLAYAEANAMKAMRNTYEKLDELSADKSAIVAEKMFNISQISKGNPTGIMAIQTAINTRFSQVCDYITDAAAISGQEESVIAQHYLDSIKDKGLPDELKNLVIERYLK